MENNTATMRNRFGPKRRIAVTVFDAAVPCVERPCDEMRSQQTSFNLCLRSVLPAVVAFSLFCVSG